MRRPGVIVACTILLTAVALAAVGAVYEINPTGGNGAAGASGDRAGGGASPANPGRIAAFVVHPSPEAVSDVAFEAPDGATAHLSDWRGRVVLVNLWATWCAPCRHEMPTLDRLQARLGGPDFEVVAISLDRGSTDKPKALFEEIGIAHLKLYHDPSGRIGSDLRAIGMPTTLLLDREGREVGRLAGPAEWDTEAAIAKIRAASGLDAGS